MANGHGGARIGAGKPKKPLYDKVLEGNPGKRPLTIVDFGGAAKLEAAEMPPPKNFMSAYQQNGKTTFATEIYKTTWDWLSTRNCAHLVPAQLIEQYAQSCARWIQCEEAITENGFIAQHPTTGNAIVSPYVSMSQSFMKQSNNLWFQIFQVVRENNAQNFTGQNPHNDIMEKLLTERRSG